MAGVVLAQQAPLVSSGARVLFQNDLTANFPATSALYLSQQVSYGSAGASCQAYNEGLLSSVDADVASQLKYLVFAGDVKNSSQIWVGASNSGNSTNVPARFKRQSDFCSAYSIQSNSTSQVDCSAILPVLCTQSAPPFSAGDGNVTNGSQISIRLNDSTITGFRDARSFRFLGIPFAQPPIGRLRFQPAQALNSSAANISATAFAPSCIQDVSTSRPVGIAALSEDCLYLNIFTPTVPSSQNSSRPLPVAFWIYGGGVGRSLPACCGL